MKSGGIVLNVLIGLTALLMVLPGISGALGPGQMSGRIPNSTPGVDDWYWTNPQTGDRGLWSTVYTFDDLDENEWTTGFAILDLNYRDFTIPDPFVYYVDYMTIPWVAITWNSLERIIYPFDDYGGSMNNQIMWSNSSQYQEGNNGVNPAGPTSMNAQYNLDCNDDDTTDFTFEIWYQLNVNPNAGTGSIDMNIRVTNHPHWMDHNNVQHEWALDGDSVRYMEFPFLFNPDIQNETNNDVQWKDTVWTDVDEEGSFQAANGADCIKVNEGANQIIMKSGNCGQSSSTWYVIKYDSGGQFSKFPSAYDNSEDIDDADVEIWYLANFSRVPIMQAGWVTANYYDLTSP